MLIDYFEGGVSEERFSYPCLKNDVVNSSLFNTLKAWKFISEKKDFLISKGNYH